MKPKRIQRKRSKGWRMPEGAVYVGRGSKWGNPWPVGKPGPDGDIMPTAQAAADRYETYLHERRIDVAALRGKDLACWCAEDAPYCHADVLMEVANE